jgi:hypothetical protein
MCCTLGSGRSSADAIVIRSKKEIRNLMLVSIIL